MSESVKMFRAVAMTAYVVFVLAASASHVMMGEHTHSTLERLGMVVHSATGSIFWAWVCFYWAPSNLRGPQ